MSCLFWKFQNTKKYFSKSFWFFWIFKILIILGCYKLRGSTSQPLHQQNAFVRSSRVRNWISTSLPSYNRSRSWGFFRFYVGNFLFSMQRTLQWYQSLDLFVDVGAIRTKGVVSIDIFVATFSRALCISTVWWDWSGPNLPYSSAYERPVPRLTCNLYCISG